VLFTWTNETQPPPNPAECFCPVWSYCVCVRVVISDQALYIFVFIFYFFYPFDFLIRAAKTEPIRWVGLFNLLFFADLVEVLNSFSIVVSLRLTHRTNGAGTGWGGPVHLTHFSFFF